MHCEGKIFEYSLAKCTIAHENPVCAIERQQNKPAQPRVCCNVGEKDITSGIKCKIDVDTRYGPAVHTKSTHRTNELCVERCESVVVVVVVVLFGAERAHSGEAVCVDVCDSSSVIYNNSYKSQGICVHRHHIHTHINSRIRTP